MEELDPEAYRHFLVYGIVMARGQANTLFMPASGKNLPEGTAAAETIAANVLAEIAAVYQDVHARWSQVTVMELPSPRALWTFTLGANDDEP